jgi:excisionase family DNA binding protein
MDDSVHSREQQATENPAVWLTLHEVSAQLGVAPSTVRRWADAGRIPARRTEGGHRRFDPAAVRALRASLAPVPAHHAHPAGPPTIGQLAVSTKRLGQQPWHAHFAAASVGEEMRGLGQRLLGLLIQYLVWQGDNSRFLHDGRQMGARYGQIARDAGISMRDTVQAFLYFRGTFWRTALQMPAVTQASDVAEVMRIAERIDHFMNEVLLSTISAYE